MSKPHIADVPLTALILKNLGFTEETRDFYDFKGHWSSRETSEDWNTEYANEKEPRISCPYVAHVFEWLRKKHLLVVTIPLDYDEHNPHDTKSWQYNIFDAKNDVYYEGAKYPNYNKAEENALKTVLTKIY